jgi:hypothetical protein
MSDIKVVFVILGITAIAALVFLAIEPFLTPLRVAFLVVLIFLAGSTWKLARLFGSFWRRWARKDLSPGDVSALRELRNDGQHPHPARLQRLRGRGFIEEHEGDRPRVTMKGRVALLLGQPVRARRMAFWGRPTPALADRKQQAMSKARGEPAPGLTGVRPARGELGGAAL